MSDPPNFNDQGDGENTALSHAQDGALAPTKVRRILALDVGDRRVGLAISDPFGSTAIPLFTLKRTTLRTDLKSIARVLRKHLISDVVVGLPLHASGALSLQAAKSRNFADVLREQHPQVRFHLLDERLTTAEAHTLLDTTRSGRKGRRERQERNAIIDQVAAVLLLEAFLNNASPRPLPPATRDV